MKIIAWDTKDIEADVQLLGLSGSPTKVKKIESVVLQSKESKHLSASDNELEGFIKELIENHTIG